MLPIYLIHWRQVGWCVDAAESILGSDIPVILTIINNSPEDRKELIDRIPAGVEVVDTDMNLGYTGGGNMAIRSWLEGSDSEFAVIGSHDLTVESDALGILLRMAHAFPEFGILGPKIEGRDAPNSQTLVDASWLSGTCLLLRRECITSIGGFDEALGSYCEDVDICWRAVRQGWRVGHCSSARVAGRGSGSPKARDAAMINGVRVKRLYKGNLEAAIEFGRIVVCWLRCLVGSALPFRSGPGRRASWSRFCSLSKSLRNVSVVWAEPKIST